MNYENRNNYDDIANRDNGIDLSPSVMSAESLIGNEVYNHQDEDLGDIKDIMLDINNGNVSYAVLSFGTFLGMGEKLFAVPWQALTLDTENKRFVLDANKEKLVDAPGFDKDNWPDMADQTWENDIHKFYQTRQQQNDIR